MRIQSNNSMSRPVQSTPQCPPVPEQRTLFQVSICIAAGLHCVLGLHGQQHWHNSHSCVSDIALVACQDMTHESGESEHSLPDRNTQSLLVCYRVSSGKCPDPSSKCAQRKVQSCRVVLLYFVMKYSTVMGWCAFEHVYNGILPGIQLVGTRRWNLQR